MFRNLRLAALLVSGLIGLHGAAVAGEIYTWVDENGVTQFSDTPPPTEDEEYEQLELQTDSYTDEQTEYQQSIERLQNDPDLVAAIQNAFQHIGSGVPGTPFPNNEGQLPPGNYQQYAVNTPGGGMVVEVETGRTYFTEDNYQSFILIDPGI